MPLSLTAWKMRFRTSSNRSFYSLILLGVIHLAGPPANPFSRKSLSGANGEWVTLPADGYDGDLPSWPLHNDPSTAEEALWMDLWRTPQAAMWAESGFERVVARYVMVTVLSEEEPTAAMLSEVRQLEDRLGLSPMALKRLQWVISEPSSGELAEVIEDDRFAGL